MTQPTPQQTFQTLMQELSASGSTPLVDPSGNKLTLREAIGWCLTKLTYILDLGDRPRPPTQGDDLYGHVLSARAEGLITQAIVTELAAKAGVDVQTIRANVVASLNEQ